MHVNVENNILMQDSLEYEDQKQYWENKKKMDAKLLLQMNKEINQEQNDEEKQLTTPFDEKKSLRNTFNFQERASQTFNNPIRQKGYKTDPPICTTFAVETT